MTIDFRIRSLAPVLLATVPLLAQAAPEDSDPSFGTGGSTISELGGSGAVTAGGIARDAQDRVYLLVQRQTEGSVFPPQLASNEFEILRYSADGVLDTAFGDAGRLAIDDGGSTFAGLLVDDTGNGLLLTGVDESTLDAVVARFNFQGQADFAFGDQGFARLSLGQIDTGTALLIQPDGAILVGGESFDNSLGSFNRGFAARLNSDGSQDLAFGDAGYWRLSRVRSDGDAVVDLALDSDGRILLCGHTVSRGSPGDLLLARLSASGISDASFGPLGVNLYDFGRDDACAAVQPQSSGKIGLASLTGNTLTIARIGNDNGLDPSFDLDGMQSGPLESTIFPRPAIPQRDGKLVLATANGAPRVELVRVEGSPELAESLADSGGGGGGGGGGGSLGLLSLAGLLAAAGLRRR
ncbi:MAG: hypothetical protein ACT4PZ_13980 [Panacagrimonas sp.]